MLLERDHCDLPVNLKGTILIDRFLLTNDLHLLILTRHLSSFHSYVITNHHFYVFCGIYIVFVAYHLFHKTLHHHLLELNILKIKRVFKLFLFWFEMRVHTLRTLLHEKNVPLAIQIKIYNWVILPKSVIFPDLRHSMEL